MMLLQSLTSDPRPYWEDAEGAALSPKFADRGAAMDWAMSRGWFLSMGDENNVYAINGSHRADWVGKPERIETVGRVGA